MGEKGLREERSARRIGPERERSATSKRERVEGVVEKYRKRKSKVMKRLENR